MSDFAKLIKEERIKQKISCTELGRKAGCTGNAIKYWENQHRTPSIDSADKVLKALGVTYTLGK